MCSQNTHGEQNKMIRIVGTINLHNGFPFFSIFHRKFRYRILRNLKQTENQYTDIM
jgi:hypothetical protein